MPARGAHRSRPTALPNAPPAKFDVGYVALNMARNFSCRTSPGRSFSTAT